MADKIQIAEVYAENFRIALVDAVAAKNPLSENKEEIIVAYTGMAEKVTFTKQKEVKIYSIKIRGVA